ncbi:hypothetical protein K144316041_p20550 (plasmid) [Clostridium tetani]|uniref:hypothetical protein n=1 Tax=Clostridium tetani TaxID=1513 RepID=UPI0029529DC3|nr:hypothetical protein [Clostridium tetani]BDR74216.1 hypothetical protein K144316041_p20550 [Clostridium tetani]
MYKCTKGFALEKCDDDGFIIENEYEIIEQGSLWAFPTEEYYILIGGKVGLEGVRNKFRRIEIAKETLEEHFIRIREESKS